MLDLSALTDRDFSGGPVGVAVLRNEVRRLPGWLNHYRSIGVRQFVIVDNGSSDGSPGFLASQPDVVLIENAESFKASNFGMDWINQIKSKLPRDVWVVDADGDEYLVYRGWPDQSLGAYLSRLPPGCDAVVAVMLDMYPFGDLSEADPSSDLVRTARYFDRRYHFRLRPKRPFDRRPLNVQILGGPRVRYLSSFEHEAKAGWLTYSIRGQIDRLIPFVPTPLLEPFVNAYPASMPSMKKVPLTRGDTQYVNSHDIYRGRYHAESAVLLHFKFTAEFAEKIRVEIARAVHFRRGAEYILYKKIMKRSGGRLYDEAVSHEFRTSQDLIDTGLIRDIAEYVKEI